MEHIALIHRTTNKRLEESDMYWQVVTALAAVVTVIISILIAVISVARESHTRLIDNFNKLYQKTFSLRAQLTSIIQKREGEEFFYETDRILCCQAVHERVLDYLTEMENFFFLVVDHRSVYRSFEKLMSLALYQRLVVFYGFILRERRESKNPRLFLNYEEALKKIGNMNKIKKQLPNYKKRCYIGIRSSDRMYDSNYFRSDISIFSEDSGPQVFPVRPNQNRANKFVVPFMADRIDRMLSQTSEWRFAFYNGTMAYNLPQEFHRYFICLNPRELLQWLNDKPTVKSWLSNCDIPVFPYETFLGQEITLSMLKKRFPRAGQCIIQSNYGGGGMGTFLVSTDRFDEVKPLLQPLRQYMVSSYAKHSVSVNTHVFISDKQTVLSPGSIQIIELDQGQLCYRGADFIAFRTLPNVCREQVRSLSLKIANRLRERGYRGAAGIDFIVTGDQNVYCMEINPRLQASTVLLDMYLQEHKTGNSTATSVFALNEQAFSNLMTTTLCFDDIINYSCYFYYKGTLPLEYLREKHDTLARERVILHDDGFLSFADEKFLDPDSYLFRAVFPHKICAVSPDMTLMLNDNIPVKQAPPDLLDLKIALLNQGVNISGPLAQVKKAAYESVDITFKGAGYCADPVVMNCAYQVNLSQYSPFTIKTDANNSILTYYGVSLGDVTIEKDQLADLPETDRRILYLSTDRLRIKLVAGCEYKNIGRGCRFCDLPMSDKRFTRDELRDALIRLKSRHLSFRHILIGGGTCLAADIWEDVIWLCRFLSEDDWYKDKPISLMSVLPPLEMLPAFQRAGLTEVAFNIELSDDQRARALMPGKRGQTKIAYYTALEKAVQIFGVGAVRSALLAGMEPEEVLFDEVKHLAQMGVIPCLSAFRALPKSEFSGEIHPDNATLRRIYDTCARDLADMGGPIKELGPKCRDCRNNMLAI